MPRGPKVEAASDQAVVGIDGAIAALGAARFVPSVCPCHRPGRRPVAGRVALDRLQARLLPVRPLTQLHFQTCVGADARCPPYVRRPSPSAALTPGPRVLAIEQPRCLRSLR